MPHLFILEAFWDTPFIAGYSLGSFSWWVDIIVLIIIVVLVGTLYFLLAWLFGRMKFQEGDKETLANYRNADRKEKKEIAKTANRPVKNVITWHKMKPWFIPVIAVVSVLALTAAPVVASPAFENLLTTLGGSRVKTYDGEAAKQAAAEAEKNVVAIQEEGTVLLKNTNNVLPLKNNKINVFGACAFGLFYGNGGSGSFQTDGRVKSFPRIATKLEVAMEEEGLEINNNLYNLIKNYYSNERNRKISIAESDYDIQCGFNKYTYSEIVPSKAPYDNEPPVEVYNRTFDELDGKTLLEDAKEFSDTALFCITRRGSEDEDMNIEDLQLKQNEKDAIKMLEENFDKVIILLNVPTVIEAEFLNDEAIDAAIFMGHPGLTGTKAVAEILTGTVNPSGRLVDTWPYDVKSAPSYQNFGNDTTLKYTSGAANGQKFTNYQEGIYVGYRYYVTRGKVDPDYNYEEEVQYSFGHGLSYTTFDKSIVDFNVNLEEQKITMSVQVRNTGKVAGKEVVQIYVHAPYNPGGIEKAYYSLCAFLKTDLLGPNEIVSCPIEISLREIASWSTEKGYYVLEAGDYEFSLRENAWDIAQTNTGRKNYRNYKLNDEIEFKNSYQTGKAYENIFQDVEFGGGEEKIQYLSRNDFAGTWKNTKDISTVSNANASHFPGGASNTTAGRNISYQDNQIEGETPTMGANNGLTLRDLKDADWDDPRWESLLDQLSKADLQNLVDQGSFKTAAISSIGKAETKDYDGPGSAFHSGTGHPSEVIVACSWDVKTAKLMGESIGREGAARGMTGWYAPGINTHRSPFGGRNFEYYSEDPLIGGLMAGNTAQGTLKYGVYAYAKHFICNDQENSRAGVFVWATEQAIREIYARGFEIYVDMGGLGIMSSFNCVGSWWAGASKALLTTLLREEWGFHGVVVTDYAGPDYMATNIGLRAGNDLWLNKASYPASSTWSATPHDAAILMRRAAKNILYACAHSNNVWTKEEFAEVGIEEFNKATDRS